jgi:DivIVA domain-containing protein
MPDEPRIVISSEPSIGAEEVARRTFATSFRGYDPGEVRAFLRRVADEIGSLREREADLRRRLEEAQRAASAPPPLDEAALMEALGEETARVLRSAREAAAEITRKAEQKVAAVVREAQDEAARVREAAEGLLARRTAEAEEAANALRAEAQAEAAAIRARAQADAESLIEEARATAREMVQEAQALRERVLADLARRRRLAQVHVEQLRAGRERLLEAYRLVRRTLDEVTGELGRAEDEARAAAEEAGRRAAAEAGATLEELEAELAAVRAGGPASAGGPGPEAAPAGDAGSVLVDAEPEVAPDEGVPAGPPGAELSSPRTVRLGRLGANGEPVELAVVEPTTADESVRVLPRPEPPAAPEAASPQPPGAPGGAPSSSPAGGESVADEPRPPGAGQGSGGTGGAPGGPEETAVDESVAAGRSPGDEVAGDGSPGVPGGEAAEGPATGGAADGGGTGDEGVEAPSRPARDIEALFARIRADRERAVARAEAVLASDGTGAPGDAATSGGLATAEEAAEAPSEEAAVAPEAGPVSVDDADEARLQQRDALLEPVEAALVRRLKRALQDEQNAVLDALRTRRGVPAPDDILPAPAAQAAPYQREAAVLLAQAAEAGALFANGSLTAVAVPVEAVAGDLAAEVVAPLRERVGRALADAVEEGADAVESISSAYREWRLQRIEPVARHAVARAFALGSYAAQPDGAVLRWVVDDDGQPCPDCDDNALAGPTAKGDPYPTGQLHPPAHPGCRCLLVRAEG